MDPILIVLLISKIRNVKVGDQVPPEKRGGYRPMWHCRFHHPCFGLWFRKGWIHKPYTIEFSGGDTSAIPCPGWVCGVMGGRHICHAMPRMSMRSYGGATHLSCHAKDEYAELWGSTHMSCPGWVCGVMKQQTFATGIFKTEFVIFWQEQEMNALSFFIKPFILLTFCTTY